VKAKNGGNWIGLVRILDLDLTNPESPVWTQAAADIFDEKPYDSEVSLGKSVSLSGDGKILAFGSPMNGDGTHATTELGRVRVYDIHEGATCPSFEWMCLGASMPYQNRADHMNTVVINNPDIISSRLLSVHNALVNEMIVDVVTSSGMSTGDVFIGYEDRIQEGTWQWADESTENCYSNWNENEPTGDLNDCALYSLASGLWSALPCDLIRRAMYQITTQSAINPGDGSDLHCLALEVPNACEVCGDNLIVGNEICDGTDLGGETCHSQGFTTGTLSCAADCGYFVTSDCDTDEDQVADGEDNCINDPNPHQDDADNDGVGDLCDPCFGDNTAGDSDGDGYCDDVDNCINDYNPDQADTDGDGFGDACDDTFDGNGAVKAVWEGILGMFGPAVDENTDYVLLADQLAAAILAILTGTHGNGSVLVTITSINGNVLSHNRRSLQEPDTTAMGYEVQYTLSCPNEPTCSSWEMAAQTDIDAIPSSLDLIPGTILGDYTVQLNNIGEPSTVIVTPDLAHRQENAATAKEALESYTAAKSAYEIAEHNLAVVTTECLDATADALAADALAAERLSTYTQADEYATEMQSIYDDAVILAESVAATAADKTWKLLKAKADLDVALAEEAKALEASNEAAAGAVTATTYMDGICDMSENCDESGGGIECKGEVTQARNNAKTVYDDALLAVNNNPNIPAIDPTTLDFVYVDTDGDLIPNEFDACPTKMGLRKDSPEIPGPQDFCPSGCPELDNNGTPLDSDGDTIPDCEDRCPFQHGIAYNHNWFKGADLSSLPRDLDYNGCPDSDLDGIPDIFDTCPDQAGGSCYSGCPDRGVDPSTGSAFDADLDGISDCADRCPNTYGVSLTDGCPDLDMDGIPDHRDYCMASPGSAEFSYERKLQDGQPMKYLNILGCPDADNDLVPDAADLCDAPTYPNQGPTTANLDEYTGIHVNGVPSTTNFPNMIPRQLSSRPRMTDILL
jgi:tetratricopeptide (TPR) repeat protein